MILSLSVYTIVAIVLCLLAYNISLANRESQKLYHRSATYRSFSLMFTLLIFAAISGLRYNVGVDHGTYMKFYLDIQNQGWTDRTTLEPGFLFIMNALAGSGIHYSFSDKMIGKILIVYGLFILLSVPAGFMSALLVSRVYGDVYWYLTAVELVGFAGMALGGVLMGMWGGFKSRLKTFAFGLLILSIMTIGMGVSPYFILYLVMMFVYSIALTMIQTATTTIIQEKAESSMLGRVFGLMGAMYSGFLPVGMAIFGPLADMLPLQWIMVGSGIALVLVTVYLQVKAKLNF